MKAVAGATPPSPVGTDWPVVVCLLGNFRLLKGGQPVAMRNGGKTEVLLASLALSPHYTVSRDTLLATLWPQSEPELANQSLNSLVYSLRKLLSDQLGGAAPVIYSDGAYRLNVEAGVGVDVALFDALVDAGDWQITLGNTAQALISYAEAARYYDGALCGGSDVQIMIERERLRGRYLSLLARLADDAFERGDYTASMAYAHRILLNEPCREDAHRLVMGCYLRRGERAQALRQYRVCHDVLSAEFGALPEPATVALFDQIRIDPVSLHVRSQRNFIQTQ